MPARACPGSSGPSRASGGGVSGTLFNLYVAANLTTATPYPFPAPGDYRFTIRARGTPFEGLGPDMELRVNGRILTTFANVGATIQNYVHTETLPAGATGVTIGFINDASGNGEDRNLLVDYLIVEGPLGAGTGTARLTAAQAKLITGRLAVRATEEAVQIHGGYGFIEEYPVCRFYRDAKILTIGEGTDEVQQMVIARALGA